MMQVKNIQRAAYERDIADKLKEAGAQVGIILSRGRSSDDHQAEFETAAIFFQQQLEALNERFLALKQAGNDQWNGKRLLFEVSFTDFIDSLDKETRVAEDKVLAKPAAD